MVEPENWLQIRDTFKLADVAKVEVVAAPADSESGATAEAAAPKKKAQPKAKAKGTEGKTQPKAKAKGTEGKTQQPKKKKADRSRGAAVSIAVPDQVRETRLINFWCQTDLERQPRLSQLLTLQ